MNLFQYITAEFAAIQTDSPEAEAKLVIESLYGNDFFQKVSGVDLSKFKNVLERRKKHEPIQYILGKAFFFNSEFIVTPDVLIPRPETEIMVEKLIEFIPENGVMADIGCGSGCIGISVALERPDIRVYAFDISKNALAVAKQNAQMLHADNVCFFESDLLSGCPDGVKFNAVGANLPYIPEVDYIQCQSEVKDYEPQLALTTGDNGLEIIIRCVGELPFFMLPGAKAFFEIDSSQTARMMQMLSGNGWILPEIIKDYTGRERFVVGTR